MSSRRRLYKQGNSVVLALPTNLMHHMDVSTGDQVALSPGPLGTVILSAVGNTRGQDAAQTPSPRGEKGIGQP